MHFKNDQRLRSDSAREQKEQTNLWEEKALAAPKRNWEQGTAGGPANEMTEEPLARITRPAAEMETALRAH